MEKKLFYFADDIMNLLNCKKSKAHQIMKKLNRELEKKGFLYDRGKVCKKYFDERYGV